MPGSGHYRRADQSRKTAAARFMLGMLRCGDLDSREMPEKLQMLLGAVDWRAGQQTRVALLSEIGVKLNELPEAPYPEAL